MAKKTTTASIVKKPKARTTPNTAVILKQRYEGRCGGIMKYAESEVTLAVFDSMEAFYDFWTKNYKEPFSHGNPFDPHCRRDGFYLEQSPLISTDCNMKKMLSYIHPVREWRSEGI